MKKSSKGASKGSLKTLKEQIEKSFADKNYDEAIPICEKFINLFPKNTYGYLSYIKALTFDYNKYLSQDEFKTVKKIYNDVYELSSKNDKIELKNKFDDYVYDLKEVENLKKIKKEITSKEYIKNMYNDALTYINQNLNTALSYGKTGSKIKNRYDFLNGLFLLILLIYNIFNPNYLLVLTIPFGIFGIITIYSFIEMNFFRKGKYKLEKETYQKIIDDANNKIINFKTEIKNIDDELEFLRNQKTSSINKLPELFLNDIEKILANDEKKLADELAELFNTGDIVKFSCLLENEADLKADEIIERIKKQINNKEDNLTKFVSDKITEKKNNQNKALFMKKINREDNFRLIVTLILSILSLIILVNNFKHINLEAFIYAILIGILSMLIYNANTGKHSSVKAMFGDNLLATTFNASLVYDLVYYKVTGTLKLVYAFIQIPIILSIILSGFVMLISILKYRYLLKKLRS